MCPSSFVEETQVVAQAEPQVPRFEKVAILLGLASCSIVLLIGLVLYLAEFQVDHRIVNASLALIAVAAVTTFFRIRPAARLTPTERMVRGKRQVFVLIGLMTGAAILGSIATAAELDTAEDWLMLGFIASSPIGLFFLVNTRFSIA